MRPLLGQSELTLQSRVIVFWHIRSCGLDRQKDSPEPSEFKEAGARAKELKIKQIRMIKGIIKAADLFM